MRNSNCDRYHEGKGSNQRIPEVPTLDSINTEEPSKASLTSQYLGQGQSCKGRLRWTEGRPSSWAEVGTADANTEASCASSVVCCEEEWGIRQHIKVFGSDSNCIQNEKVSGAPG